MAGEKELYPIVEKYIVQKLGCKATKINTGTRYGQIDVLGLRERCSDLASQTELVSVEVKRGGTRFLNFVGQALSYSLYTHRVYLAWYRDEITEYTQEEIDIASKFGVGLLIINKKWEVHLEISSSEFNPEHHHLLQVINKLGYFECTLCRSYYPSKGLIEINQKGSIDPIGNPPYLGRFSEAVLKSKPALYYLFQLAKDRGDERYYTYDRRYICTDCIGVFASITKG